MQYKKEGFTRLSDIFAFRIVTKNEKAAYIAMGSVHSRWRAVPGKFKDYISHPKSNGYRSIHTTVSGRDGKRVEVQIRTEEMDEVAESGIAAHWSYRDGEREKNPFVVGPFKWLRGLSDGFIKSENPSEFFEHVKLEMFQEQVFCFTPKGDLIHLPLNSNPIDFAYALHSEIGNMCIGCKVNGKSQPLFTKLQNGDEVEILTSRGQEPSEVWENIATTAKAQSSIKRYFKKQENNDFLDLGKRILRNSLGFSKDVPEDIINEMINKFKKKTFNDLLIAIGKGHIKNKEIIKFKPRKRLSFFNRYRKNPNKKLPLEIKGLQPGLAVHFAECCLPLPGEDIFGISEVDVGVIIHSANCKKLIEDFSEDLWLSATWKDVSKEQLFTSRIKIYKNSINIFASKRPLPYNIFTEEHPGFPTDLQAQYMTLMSIADGECEIRENIFENRFMHVPELIRMGARISVKNQIATVTGVNYLKASKVMASDLRASMCLILGGLAAKGITEIDGIHHLDRGYENIEYKLSNLGADIRRAI